MFALSSSAPTTPIQHPPAGNPFVTPLPAPVFTDTASLSEAPPSEIFICAIRPNAEGQLFQLKTTSTKGAYLTDIARANLVFDYNYLKDLEKDNIIRNKIAVIAELKAKGKKQRQPVLEKATMPRGRPKSFTTKIAEWYQVTSDAVRRITAKASARASTAQAPRSGRPRIVTPRKEAALLDTFNQEQGPPMRRLTALTEEALKDRGIDYETSYGSSEKRRSMSKTTVTNVVKKKFDLHDLKIKGRFHHPHWIAHLFASMAKLNISIISGSAIQVARWAARETVTYSVWAGWAPNSLGSAGCISSRSPRPFLTRCSSMTPSGGLGAPATMAQ